MSRQGVLMRATSLAVILLVQFTETNLFSEDLTLSLRYQTPVETGSSLFHTLSRSEVWKGEQTALIVCDVWDSHNCKNAVLRVEEMVPRLKQVVDEARRRGVTIIHAPSNCMDYYEQHPARKRAINAPQATNHPPEITKWCYQIPAEEAGVYPIDQTNGGCDDEPEEHAAWQASIAHLKVDRKWPWRKQHDSIKIDEQQDYITDKGDEVWNILQQHGIKNVILTGVHTNMCVLGRPFGLRRMVESGMNTVLMRDQTDTMYDPRSEPYVSHFTGTDLIIGHIERHVCPTILSTDFIGGEEFRFSKDTRPHIAILIGEREYDTKATLPIFAIDALGKDYRTTLIHANPNERNDFPGVDAIAEADALLVSVRRRVLPSSELQFIKDFIAAGKPVIGIRTASHAFSLRNQEPPAGLADWPEFDKEVFGGNYTNHHGNKLKCTITFQKTEHPVLKGLKTESFIAGGSLYKTSPLAAGTTVLALGKVEGHPAEPVAWTFTRKDGGRSFYTSLGHVEDFKNPQFVELLKNGIDWATKSRGSLRRTSVN